MKKYIIFLFLCFSTNAASDWVKFATNDEGSEYFYDINKIRKLGDRVLLWVRTRYAEPSKYKDQSSEIYQQINCTEYSFRYIQAIYYKDKNWKSESATEGKQPKINIPDGSAIAYLANIVCSD